MMADSDIGRNDRFGNSVAELLEQRETALNEAKSLKQRRLWTMLRYVLTHIAFQLRYFELKWNLWRPGFIAGLAPFLGLLAFIFVDQVSGLRTVAAVTGLIVGALTATLMYVLLYTTHVVSLKQTSETLKSQLDDDASGLEETEKSLVLLNDQLEYERHRLDSQSVPGGDVRSDDEERNRLYLKNWKAMRGTVFERYVAGVFQALGHYIEAIPAGDHGVHLIVEIDGVRCAVQINGFQNRVDANMIRNAIAGREHNGCKRCIVITNNSFTLEAQGLAEQSGVLTVHEDNFRDFVLGHLRFLD